MPTEDELKKFELLEREIRLSVAELKVVTDKLKEDKLPKDKSKDNSALWVAVVAGIFTAIGYLFQTYQAHQLALDTLHSSLILKAIDYDTPQKRKTALLFYIKTGLLDIPVKKIEDLPLDEIPSAPVAYSSSINGVGNGTYAHSGSAVVIHCGFCPDPDGSPRAYNPDGNSGLDRTVNTGHPGNWIGLVTDDGTPHGNPLIQGPDDPAPGYYISQTPLVDPSKKVSDPRRYVNSETVNYVVLPGNVAGKQGEPDIGDLAAVVNAKAKAKTVVFAVVADFGPSHLLGGGSILLAKALGLPSDPRTGGTPDGVVMVVFPKSAMGWPKTQQEIDEQGATLFKAWGGLDRINSENP